MPSPSKSEDTWQTAGSSTCYGEAIAFTSNYINNSWDPPMYITLLHTIDTHEKHKNLFHQRFIGDKDFLKLLSISVAAAYGEPNTNKPEGPHIFPNASDIQENKEFLIHSILEKEKLTQNIKQKLKEKGIKLIGKVLEAEETHSVEL